LARIEEMRLKPEVAPERVKTIIKVKLHPRSSRNQFMGREGDVFKVKVTSPPVHGRANRALTELLAKRLKLPKGDVEIVSGKSSRMKQVRIHGLSKVDITGLLEK